MATIAVPIIVIIPDMLRQRRWRSYLCPANFIALLIGLCIYIAPLVYADLTREGYRASGLWYAFRENITRYFRPFDHKEPFYVYFYYLPKLFFPWTVLLVGAIWTFKDNFRRLGWRTKWLGIATTLIFLFFTASGSRRSYYILPILPFCALMVSQYLIIEPKEHSKRIMLAIQTGVLIAVAAAEILSPALWPILQNRMAFVPPGEFKVVTVILGIAAIAYLVADLRRPGFLAEIIAAPLRLTRPIVLAVLIMGGFFLWQEKGLDSMRSLKSFSLQVKESVGTLPPENVVFYRDFPPKMLFHVDLSRPATVAGDLDALRTILDTKNETWILIGHNEYHDEIASVLPRHILNQPAIREKQYPWEKKKKKHLAWIINGAQSQQLTAN